MENQELVEAVFAKQILQEKIDDVQEQIDRLEAYGVTEGPKHQELLIELGRLVTKLSSFEER